MRYILFILIIIPSFLSAQDEKNKSIKAGWAIHAGAGFMYGGNIGILGEKQILLNEKIRISPFGSVGLAEGGTDSTGVKYNWFGYAAGANFEYGKKHRVIFGPHFIGQNLIGNSVEVKKDFAAGATFILGYKGTANFGLIWQIYVGAIWMQEPLLDSKKLYSNSHMGIGLGYKF